MVSVIAEYWFGYRICDYDQSHRIANESWQLWVNELNLNRQYRLYLHASTNTSDSNT